MAKLETTTMTMMKTSIAVVSIAVQSLAFCFPVPSSYRDSSLQPQLQVSAKFSVPLFARKSCPHHLTARMMTSSSSGGTSTTSAASSSNATRSSTSKKILLSEILPPLPVGSRRLYLLRHGETEWNTLGKIQGGGFDIPLNDNGRDQAWKTAHVLDGIPIDVIASSHLLRAKQTADILMDLHPSTAQRVIDNGFGEMRFGLLEGLAVRDITSAEEGTEQYQLKEQFRTISKNLQSITIEYPGGGESTSQVEQRISKSMSDLLSQHPDSKHIAVVGHGRANKILLASVIMGDVTKFPRVKQSSK